MGIYSKLRDEWDTMNGSYLGKSYAGITEIFQMMEVPRDDWRTMYDIIGIIDKYRSKVLNEKIKRNKPLK